MTINFKHPHAAFDHFPQLLDSLAEEYGCDEILSIANTIIDAEYADFHWEGRIAEMNLGACDCFDDEAETFEFVAIVGYFRGRYYYATCAVDAKRRVGGLFSMHPADSLEAAVEMFLARGA